VEEERGEGKASRRRRKEVEEETSGEGKSSRRKEVEI